MPYKLNPFTGELDYFAGDVSSSENTYVLEDEFITGENASGTTGELGWNWSNGNVTNFPELGHPGVIRRFTDTSINSVCPITLGRTPTVQLLAFGDFIECIFILQFDGAVTDYTANIGISQNIANPTAQWGAFFSKSASDTTWIANTRQVPLATSVDTGVAINNSYNKFQIVNNTTNVEFFINDTSVAIINQNIPGDTRGVNVGVNISNVVSGVQLFRFDYFKLTTNKPTR